MCEVKKVIFLYIFILIVSLFCVIYGGNLFVDSSIKLAKRTKIPMIIIGATIVSIATTLPELIVTIISSSSANYELAVGNALGSIIANTALICGLSIAIIPIMIKDGSSMLKYVLVLISFLALSLFSIDCSVSLWEACILFLLFIVFMLVNTLESVYQHKKEKQFSSPDPNKVKFSDETVNKDINNKDVNQTNLTNETSSPVIEKRSDKLYFIIIMFIIGAALIGGGAYGLVQSATEICTIIGLSEQFVGLTIVGLGTSLPELATTIVAIRKKNSALGYGNIIGANIINATLLIGVSGFFANKNGLPLTPLTLYVSVPVMVFVTLIMILPMMIKKRTYRWQGITLLTTFVLYYIYLIVMTCLGYTV